MGLLNTCDIEAPSMEARTPVIGMVGGLAPESTVFYYRSLIREGLARLGAAPMILMVSLDAQTALRLAALEDKTPMLEYMWAPWSA